MILILNVADEISNKFVLCCCKLIFNDGKVFALFVQIHTRLVCAIAVILVTPNKTAKIMTIFKQAS